jgi:hypothetical protein
MRAKMRRVWAIINANPQMMACPYAESVSAKGAINKFMLEGDWETWDEAKAAGWRCRRATLTWTERKPK